jgi:hypothetical protein
MVCKSRGFNCTNSRNLQPWVHVGMYIVTLIKFWYWQLHTAKTETLNPLYVPEMSIQQKIW